MTDIWKNILRSELSFSGKESAKTLTSYQYAPEFKLLF